MLIQKYPLIKELASYKMYVQFRKIFDKFMSKNFPVTLSKIQYKSIFGRKLNLDNPVYFNEKLMWLKFNRYTNNPVVTQCIDKYAVREYVKKNGLQKILNELYGVWDRVEDVNWDELPNRFVMKCNHGCGFNLICKDKSQLDIEDAKIKLSKWMKSESWTEYAETNYKGIPHKIICEKYIDGLNDTLPVDYKIYCFGGEPKYIGNFIERDIEKDSLVRGYFDIEWNPLSMFKYMDDMDISKFPRPACLSDMLNYASILSKPFPFVRVDFYEIANSIVFGELTFTPTGCLANYYTEEGSLKLGQLLKIF